MEFMPFADVSDLTFMNLFEPDVPDGVWEIVNGEWTFGEWCYLTSVGWRFEPYADQAQDDEDQDEQARLNEALHFGYETYGQEGPPAPLIQDPLNYTDLNADDIYDLDYANY
jgi:hypothetical protein